MIPSKTGDSDPNIPPNVEAIIADQIKSGTLKPGDRLGTAKELADKYNISFGTARQLLEVLAARGVVNRKPRAGTFISSPADSAGSSPVNHDTFALLVPDLKQAEHAYIARYVQDEAHKINCDIIVNSTDNDRDRYNQTIRRLIKSGVAGIILVAPNYERVSLETVLELRNSGIPVVVLASSLEGTGWPTIHTDVAYGTYIAVRHLCDIGKRNIAFATYEPLPPGKNILDLKRSGVYKALLEAGCGSKSPLELIVPLRFYSPEFGWTNNPELRHFIADWLDQNSDVDAICCDHDHIASAAMRVLEERGVRIPEQIALTGSCNMGQFFGVLPGELTTVDTCLPEKAAEMLRLLVRMQNGEKLEPGLKIAFKPRLVLGRSTQPHSI